MIASSRLAGAMMKPTSSAQWPKVFGPEAPGPKSRRAPPAGRGSVAGTATNLSARTVTNAFAQNVNFLSLQYLSLRPFPMVLKQLYTPRYAYGSSRARTTYSLAYRCTLRPGGPATTFESLQRNTQFRHPFGSWSGRVCSPEFPVRRQQPQLIENPVHSMNFIPGESFS